jgi:hypothetical protein
MDTKGGRVTLTRDGVTHSTRGKLTIAPSKTSRENGVNNDGTGYSMIKPRLPSATCTFDRGKDIDWDTIVLDEWDITLIEDDVGTTHLFTGAAFSGEPEIDLETGEVSGLKIESDKYQTI